MHGEAIILIFLAVLSAYFIHLSLKLPRIAGVFIGPEAWPLVLLVGILVSSTAALAYKLVKRAYYRPPRLERGGLFRVSTTIALIAAYALVFSYLGFFVSTLVLFAVYLKLLGVKTLYSVVAGLLLALMALITFPVLLLIPLPRGYGVFYDVTSYVLGIFGR